MNLQTVAQGERQREWIYCRVLRWSIDPSSRAKVPDQFKMTEEQVELTELQASIPRGKGGLSYLGQTAPIDAKTDR
jgi:hypothetical protein